MKNKNKGFTLIELLVVIAIIGILSSVVLASLNSARNKGADAAIRSNLEGIRIQAELVYDADKNYNKVCGSYSTVMDYTILNAYNAAKKAAGVGSASSEFESDDGQEISLAACHAENTTGWAVSVPLKTDNTKYACVDSAGKSIVSNSGIAAYSVVCP